MATLKILTGSLAGQEIDLNFEPNFIGRASGNDIKINDAGVSSKHAKIWAEGDSWFVMDLGSTNGTLVNNADIDREQLNSGDKLSFGPVQAVFTSVAARRAPPAPNPRTRVPEPAPAAAPAPLPAMGIGLPSGKAAELELELSTLKARYATLEKEVERVRQEAVENEKRIGELAVQNMRAEMQKLRDLMRERDESSRTLENQLKEREAYYSPEELEREKKRLEASIGLETRRTIEAHERHIRELEAKVVSRAAELEVAQRSIREKDDLIRLMSDREDRVGQTAKDREDKVNELAAQLQKAQEELAGATSREREVNDKLKQKNQQLADMGKQQAELTQEIAKARAAMARVSAGGAGAAAEETVRLTEELDGAKRQILTLRQQVNGLQDEVISAKSARDLETQKAGTSGRQIEELQGLVTDLTDEKSKLQSKVDELLRQHTAFLEAERTIAGLQAELGRWKAQEEASRKRVQQLEGETTELKKERLDLVARADAATQKLNEIGEDYKVLRAARDESFDWEARYKSQVDDFEAMRKQNAELKASLEALSSQVGQAATAGTVDDATLAYAKSRTQVLGEMAVAMVDGVNNAVSLLRRNSEVLKGYVHDCGLLANCVRQINYTLLEPDQQRMLRELIDETQPDVIIRNMESIGEENAEATNRAKRLILDFMDAMKVDEEGTDLERCFAKSQGLVNQVDPGSEVRVKVGKALPALHTSQPEGVQFAYALLREAKAMAVDEDQVPTIRVDTENGTITVMISPVHQKAKERIRETVAGGGDQRSQLILGYARSCGGRVDVKDMADAAAMFLTLPVPR